MGKKWLSLFLSLLLTVTVLPLSVSAAETVEENGFTFSVENGAATVTYYSGTEASVTIPYELSDGTPVTAIGDEAFYECTSLTSVTIPGSVQSIGDYAFGSCDSLVSVTILEGVPEIGKGMFFLCTSLSSVTIPESVKTIGDSAFTQCYSLASVTIPEGVTSIEDDTFYACRSLASVTIPEKCSSSSRRLPISSSISLKSGILTAAIVTSVGISRSLGRDSR